MAQTDAEALSSPKQAAHIATANNDAKSASGVMRFAQNAVSAQAERVSEVLNSAADAIDGLVGGANLPLPDGAKGFISSASGKLRDMADRTSEEEASKMLETLQRTAADHPAATAGLGAALGAALGLALAKLGGPASTTPPKNEREPD